MLWKYYAGKVCFFKLCSEKKLVLDTFVCTFWFCSLVVNVLDYRSKGREFEPQICCLLFISSSCTNHKHKFIGTHWLFKLIIMTIRLYFFFKEQKWRGAFRPPQQRSSLSFTVVYKEYKLKNFFRIIKDNYTILGIDSVA